MFPIWLCNPIHTNMCLMNKLMNVFQLVLVYVKTWVLWKESAFDTEEAIMGIY